MKEITEPYIKPYRPLRFFREDLEAIVDVFQKHFKEFEIIADRYELSDFSDIDKIKKQQITRFSIKHYHHYREERPWRTESLSVDLDKDSAMLYLSNNADTYLLGIASQLDLIISKKQRLLSFLASGKLVSLGLSILFVLSLIFYATLPWKYSDHSMQSILLMTLTFIPLVLGLIWLAWSFYTSNMKHTLIYLIYSSAKTGFFRRNKDQIILALTIGFITAVVTGVLTAIITSIIIHNTP